MMAWLDLAWLLLLVALASWGGAVVTLSVVGSAALRAQHPPRVRARRAVLLALLPWSLPLAVVGALAMVAASKPTGLITDHCLVHSTGHPHLCFEHLPAIGLGPYHAAGVVALFLVILLPALRLMLREWRLATRIDALQRLSDGWRRLRIVPSAEPIALAVGGRERGVLLSRGLLERLEPRERRIVLGHELAHLRHGDPWRNRLFQWLLLLHPGWLARPLRHHWRQAREELADDRVVRYPESARHDLESVRRTLLILPSGYRVPLEALADIRRDRGPNRISREDGQRQRVVSVNVAGRDLQGVVTDIRAAVAADIALPPGYHIAYGGQFERMAAANQRLLWLGAGVVAAIFVLLVAAFRSARDAGLVMLNLPLALIGGVAAVWFTSGVVTIAAIIGFITLFGIATRNGLILVDHIGRLIRERGLDVEAAVRQGSEERLVPILMTALATALALVPLALAAGQPGSEIQAPMAVVILWGLLSSTLLNMVVVPVAYRHFGRPGGAGDAEVA